MVAVSRQMIRISQATWFPLRWALANTLEPKCQGREHVAALHQGGEKARASSKNAGDWVFLCECLQGPAGSRQCTSECPACPLCCRRAEGLGASLSHGHGQRMSSTRLIYIFLCIYIYIHILYIYYIMYIFIYATCLFYMLLLAGMQVLSQAGAG